MTNFNNDYNAHDIAKVIIETSEKNNRTVSNLRLQKMLYFIQGLSYVNLGREAFSDDFEAWPYGPVVRNVYTDLAYKGSSPITSSDLNMLTTIKGNDFNTFRIDKREYKEIDAELRKLIEDFEALAASYSDFRLVNISHKQSPWKEVFDKENISNPITKSSIKEYFLKINTK